VANTLAYSGRELMTAIKSFIKQAPDLSRGVNHMKRFKTNLSHFFGELGRFITMGKNVHTNEMG
jgi:hypothetical protein